MRLFIAISLDEAVRDAICGIQTQLRSAALCGRMTRRENLHLTLAFLGENPPSQIPDIRAAMETAAGPAFVLQFSKLGRFRRDGGDIWWLGAEESAPLQSLAAALQGELRRRGFALEERKFMPHLTLGRQIQTLPEFDKNSIAGQAPPQQVSQITLFSSERVRGVLTYREIVNTPLK